jgi:DNA-binding IscR family transcriptional regulator
MQREMKLSIRGEYAPRPLIDLAITLKLGWPMIQMCELSTTEKLPVKFFEQIFAQLKAAGSVKSRREKVGRQPEKYTPRTVHQAVLSSAEDGYYETLYTSSANPRRENL